MNTEAVMCMALTRQRPSFTPLWATRSSTAPVMLRKPRRCGTSNQRYSVRDFMARHATLIHELFQPNSKVEGITPFASLPLGIVFQHALSDGNEFLLEPGSV